MQGDDLRTSDPALCQVYLEQAGKTLHGSYAKGERDPRLLAVLGLCDYDVGAKAEARSMLAAATDAGVARPAAYLDLAHLILEEARAHPAAANGKFSAEQTAAILKPLFAVRQRTRLEARGYLLIAEAWKESADRPLPAHLAALDEGIRLYPFDSELCASAAKVYAQWGYPAGAETLIEQGLKSADEKAARQLQDLRASLQTVK